MQIVILFLAVLAPGQEKRERFTPRQDPDGREVWRITNRPAIRCWANYHNTQCWSPDGRYLCYTDYGEADRSPSVYLFDLWKDRQIPLGPGLSPRWAKRHNWLFFVRLVPDPSRRNRRIAEVIWYDVGKNERRLLTKGIEALGETDYQDRWLFGSERDRSRTPQFRNVRIPIRAGVEYEVLPDSCTGAQRLPNPRHPVWFARHDHRSEPFNATRYFYDLEGRNRTIAAPTVQQCHMSWIGNGEYLLLGNGLIRGRRWDEPFPSNLHILAAVSVGDVSPCGLSGRYVCGDNRMADLRSGDGWETVEPLSIVCYPESVADNSGIYDADPKGSPDGTKICFVSNYDLKSGPVTRITEDESRRTPDVLKVESTAGFPDRGALVVRREVIGYARRTATTFEGLTRTLHDTVRSRIREGGDVTSFEARCLTDEQWKKTGGVVSRPMAKSIPDPKSPLRRQRQTDVYVVVVRLPDRPYLRLQDAGVQLIPGEEHYETFGYHLLRGEERVTTEPIRPGTEFEVNLPGAYRAVAVEWSGLESRPSIPLKLERPTKIRVLADPPSGFSWTQVRAIDGSNRDLVHLYDGVIRRQGGTDGRIDWVHDLNKDGKAIRRVRFQEGRPARREYYTAAGRIVSRELFNSEGFTTEWVTYRDRNGKPFETDHWWYERGMPVKRQRPGVEYVKQGDRWVESRR